MPSSRRTNGAVGTEEERGRLLPQDSSEDKPNKSSVISHRTGDKVYQRLSSVDGGRDDAPGVMPSHSAVIEHPLQHPEPDAVTQHSAGSSRQSSVDQRVEGRGSLSASKSSSQGLLHHKQKVVYYQNRFITVNIDPGRAGPVVKRGGSVKRQQREAARGGEPSSTLATNPTGGCSSSSIPSATGGASSPPHPQPPQGDTNTHDSRSPLQQQQQHVTATASGSLVQDRTMQPVPGTSAMDPMGQMGSLSAIPGVMNIGPNPTINIQHVDGPQGPVKKAKPPQKKDTIFDKIAQLLQDNRVKHGDREAELKLRSINRTQDSGNVILKRILNIIFLTTGVSLLIGVIIVIVYTAIASRCPTLKDPRHGYINPDRCDDCVGCVCELACHSGYTLEGTPRRVCQNDSTWSGNDVSCVGGNSGHQGTYDYIPVTEPPHGPVYEVGEENPPDLINTVPKTDGDNPYNYENAWSDLDFERAEDDLGRDYIDPDRQAVIDRENERIEDYGDYEDYVENEEDTYDPSFIYATHKSKSKG